MVLVSVTRSPRLSLYLSAVIFPRMQEVWSFSNASYSSCDILASPKMERSLAGSMANWAKVMFSSLLNLPPNQLNGEMDSTPGMRSMIGRWRAGNRLAMETRLRTTTRKAAPTSSGGIVSSRKATCRVTSRNRLTATLKMERVARRLFRKAFLRMNEPMVMQFGRQFLPRNRIKSKAWRGGAAEEYFDRNGSK